MWQWIEPVFQYGSGPVIAAGALLWQQQRTDTREERLKVLDQDERLKDREHQRSLADEDRRSRLEEAAATLQHQRSLADDERAQRLEELAATLQHERELREAERRADLAAVWRSERRDVYARFTSFVEAIDSRLTHALYGPTRGVDNNFLPDQQAARAIPYDLEQQFEQLVADIRLLGAMPGAQAAWSVMAEARNCSTYAFYACEDPTNGTWTRADAIKYGQRFDEARERFLVAVREDLGVQT
jgi:hypothetical protein